MKSAFFEKNGENPAENSFEEKVIEALASELYGLSGYADFIMKQSFVQTATGEYLDKLGAVRDCVRKEETRALGSLTFFNSAPAEAEIQIGKGTICSVKGQPFIQFETTQDAVIAVGETAVTVPAQALAAGEDYNVIANAVTVMVNAPAMVEHVTNAQAFIGGSFTESDSSYRERIIRNYTVPQNGIGKTSIENKICKLDYIADCKILSPEVEGTISVAVIMKDGQSLSGQALKDIKACVGFADMVGATVRVIKALPVNLNISADVNIREGADSEKISQVVNNAIQNVLSQEKIGRSVLTSAIVKELIGYEEIQQVDIYCNGIVNGEIVCPESSYLKLTNTAVNCYYE